MLQAITSPQLAELEAFWTIEGGWGDWKQDYRFGQLCSLQANINRNSKKQPKPYSAEDFAMRPKLAKKVNGKEAEQRIRGAFDMLAGQGESKKKRNPRKVVRDG
jgi:hypothetical protein